MSEPLIMGDKIGGQPKQRYWTPDGREILSAPNIRGTSDGGVRDANLDKGWLFSKPIGELKLYCPNCDYWHDTQVEITNCGKKKKAFDTKYMKWAETFRKNASGSKDAEIASLKDQLERQKTEVSEIKELLNKMVAQKEGK